MNLWIDPVTNWWLFEYVIDGVPYQLRGIWPEFVLQASQPGARAIVQRMTPTSADIAIVRVVRGTDEDLQREDT